MNTAPPSFIISIVFAFLYLIQLTRLIQMGVKGNLAAQRAINLWSVFAFIPLLILILNVPSLSVVMLLVSWVRENVIIVLIGVVVLAEILIRQSTKSNSARIQTIAKESHDPNKLYEVAHQLEEKKKYSEAIVIHKRVLELDPKFYKSYVNMAALAGMKGDLQEAETLSRKAIEIDSNYSNAHYYLAMALRDQGKIAEANREFKIAIRLGLPESLRRYAISQSGGSEDEETE